MQPLSKQDLKTEVGILTFLESLEVGDSWRVVQNDYPYRYLRISTVTVTKMTKQSVEIDTDGVKKMYRKNTLRHNVQLPSSDSEIQSAQQAIRIKNIRRTLMDDSFIDKLSDEVVLAISRVLKEANVPI